LEKRKESKKNMRMNISKLLCVHGKKNKKKNNVRADRVLGLDGKFPDQHLDCFFFFYFELN
jgi:hypothetical protein